MPVTRRRHGQGWTFTDERGMKVPGVTSLMRDGIPKPALTNWLVETTADYALDNWPELSELPFSERRKRLMKARYAASDKAKARGSQVHKMAEKLIVGDPVAIPEGLEGYVQAAVDFMDEFDVEPVHVEFTCYSERNQHAGLGDLIADLLNPDDFEPDPTLRGRERWLLDYKTSDSGVFGETALQLAGYRFSEFLMGDDGIEVGMPEVDRCGVVHLRRNGTYALVPVIVTEAEYRQFLYAQQTALWLETSRSLVGDPVAPPHTSTYKLFNTAAADVQEEPS